MGRAPAAAWHQLRSLLHLPSIAIGNVGVRSQPAATINQSPNRLTGIRGTPFTNDITAGSMGGYTNVEPIGRYIDLTAKLSANHLCASFEAFRLLARCIEFNQVCVGDPICRNYLGAFGNYANSLIKIFSTSHITRVVNAA